MKNTAAMPALIVIGLGVVAFFIGLFGFATAHVAVGIGAGLVAVLMWAGGFGWLRRERRRVRRVEADYLEEHPGADAQTPAS